MTIQNHSAFMSLSRSDVEDDRVTFPLSSEEPYRRWDGNEILVHTASAIDLEFLNSGNAPLLDNHNTYSSVRNVIGVIERAWISKKRIYVSVRFSKSDNAQAIKADVEDDIIRNVSIGYSVLKVERDEESDDYRVIKWRPFEASLVTVPADTTVGLGRSVTIRQEAKVMSKDAKNAPDGDTKLKMPDPLTDEQRAEALQTSIDEITELAKTHNIGDIARAYIEGAVRRGDQPKIEVFRGIARANIPEGTPLRNEDIGLTNGEREKFSVRKFLLATSSRTTAQDEENAAFELEAVSAAGAGAKGQYKMPTDIMATWGEFQVDGVRSVQFRNPMGVGTGAGGNSLQANPNVQTIDHLSGRFIDNLRNALVLGRLGLTVLDGLDSNVEIPGGDVNAQAFWLGSEDADAAETAVSFRKIGLSIHTVGNYIDLTRNFLLQSTIAVEAYCRAQLLTAVAEEVDRVGFYGSGAAGQPEGLANITGIGAVTFAGGTPTRDDLIDMRTAVASTNRPGTLSMVGNTAMAGDLMKTKVDAGSGQFLMTTEGRVTTGNPYAETNQIVDGDLFGGIYNDYMMGTWGSLELDRSTEAKFLSGGIRLRTLLSVDFALSRVGSIVLGQPA